MAANTVMNLKVFLRNDKEAEARRFSVDMSAVTSFVFMNEKLQTIFPSLRQTPFKITWKDKDGDEITIASDEDLITAFTEMSELLVKVLYIQAVQNQNQNQPQQFSDPIFIEADLDFPLRASRIVCDACSANITGLRYKCLQCPDYDLCGSCEYQGNHSEHIMMRLPNSDASLPKCARKFMHHLGREIKKSAHFANKEAYRAAKHARRFCANAAGTSQQNTSAQQPEGGQCPFASSQEGPMNFNDILGLGEMAKQHLPTLVDFLQNVAAPPASTSKPKEGEGKPADNNNANTTTTSGNTETNAAPDASEQIGLLSDAFRNLIGTFLVPASNEFEKPKTDSDSGEKTPETKQPEPMAMDVDPKPELPKRDPGWTFVATNPAAATAPAPNTQQPAAPPTAPVYPTLVYHENPKIAEGLVTLHEMGFSNEGNFLTKLLERHDGNVSAVVRAILDSKV